MQGTHLVIGNRTESAITGRTLDVINPATEQVHVQVPEASAEDVDRAVRAARGAMDEGPWGKMPASERGRLMFRLADLVEANADTLARFDSEDMGKPYTHARHHDLSSAVSFLRFYAGFTDKIRGSQIPCGPDTHVYTTREPVGVVAGIVPWNFPLVIAMQKLAPALGCGNTIVLKPAEQSPRSALALAELALEAGLPPGVVNAISGGGDTGAALAAHPLVDKISFTGSTEVGKKILHAAAEKINKVTVELGGKTANIVFPDADLEAALASCLLTSCYNSGQICTTGSRLLLHPAIHDEFLEKLLGRMKKLKVGDPMAPDTKMGPLVSREQFDRVTRYIETGKQDLKFYTGGFRPAPLNRGFYVDPLVFDHVPVDATVAQEEIFGPVISTIDFENDDEAVRFANATQYGLATAIWTRDLTRAHKLAAAMHSGFVWVNCNHYWVAQIPYEGHGASGVGVDMGIEAVESYTRLKNTIVNLDATPHPWAG
ncbi:MAG: aldehyde dehydrogenase family protein [Bryobacteraceae bacterium]